MKTITVIIRDNYPGYDDPLVYTVEVPSEHDRATVLKAVTRERLADLGEGHHSDDLDIDLLMAFEGDCKLATDWRN